MKLRYTIFVLLGVLIGGSLFNAGSVVAQSVPNTNFETGDYFYYKSTETRLDYWQDKIVLANDANTSQIYRYSEWYNEQNENVEGDLEIFLIKPGANLPAFTNPEGDFDHIILVDWSGMTVDPSTRTGWDKFYDLGDPNGPMWNNNTHPVENTAGRYYSDDENNDDDDGGDDNAMPVVSNATYLIQMSEMTENTFYFDELNRMGPMNNQDFGSFNQEIPLQSRTVTIQSGRPYTVNGVTQNIDTRIARSTFSTLFDEVFNTSISFGDPNAAFIDVEADVSIFVEYMFEYYFDATTGALLEIREDRDYSVYASYYNANTTNIGSDPSCTVDCGPSTMSVEMVNSYGESASMSYVIDEASSFYGVSRPTSNGVNRIEEGDLLVYDSESENEFSFDSDMVVGNPSTTGWESYDSQWGYSDSYGTLNFDVYRHEPGYFETVMFMEGIREGEWGYDSSGTHGGQDHSDANTSLWGPENYLDWDYMEFESSDTEEIVHFFDDNMHFNDDFLYDDNDDNDGWRLDYNREVPKSGVVNDTAFHMDFDTDDLVNINGFDHTWLDIQMFGQKYETTYNKAVQIPVSRDEDGEVWMTVQLTGEATGEQNFFYDENTGVMVAMEQRISVYLELDGNQNVGVTVHQEGQEPTVVQMNADFYASITIDERFFLLLSEHPVEYLSVESTDPVDHLTDTVISSTSSTTSATSQTSDDDGNGDLPLPVPIIPVLAALSVIVIYVRKRKY